MIRIIHFGLSPNKGGIETYLNKIWNYIDKTNFHFDFVDEWNGEACFRKKFEEMGSSFYDITPRRQSIKKNKSEWRNLLLKERPDILHCHLNTLSYVTPIKVALELKIPVVVHSRSAGIARKFPTSLMHVVNKKWMSDKDVTRLAVSTKAGFWLFGDNESFITINNGIDIERFRFSSEKRKNIRDKWGVNEDTIVLGNVGAINEAKNHSFLIDIYNCFRVNHPNTKLIIVGSGNLKAALIKKISDLNLIDSVVLLENQDDISSVLSGFDIFIMPSLFEGFPNAALEAQTSGLPVLLSDVITKEVGVLNTTYISLNEKVDFWANRIDSTKLNLDRYKAADYINERGFSVYSEIEKLSDIYNSIVKSV